MKIEIPYYEDMTRFSNSDIGFFLKNGPKALKEYKDGTLPGMSASFLEKGTMIHEYILQPDEFWSDYVILDFKTPTVAKQKEFLETYQKLCEVEPLTLKDTLKLKAYDTAYSNKKSNETKLKECNELLETYSDYLEYLSKKDTKKIISFADLNMLKQIKANIENHKKANELLYNLPETFTCDNEFHINWQPKSIDIKCKSLLDRKCIDTVNKKIILIDLKTTVNVYNFDHSVEEYDYHRQITYYLMAIYWYMENVLGISSKELEEYSVEAYIIAIGKDKNNEIRVFNMLNKKKILEEFDKITNAFKEISYHVNSNNWDHTRTYYEGDGIEEL